MAKIEMDPQLRDMAIQKLQAYFESELDRDLGQFEADFLLDFIADTLGSVFYNQGLYDAQAVLDKQFETLNDAILSLEKSVSS